MFKSGLVGRSFLRPRPLPLSTLKFTNHIFIRNKSTNSKQKEVPKVRYIFYLAVASWGVLFLATSQINKSKPKTTFNSEREFKDYEESTGLRRRNKLINYEKNSHYKFYAVPYVHLQETVDEISAKLQEYDPAKQVKVIDPLELIDAEKNDESRKYCYLLQDLDANKKPYPKGLITALIKEEVQLFLNTRLGTFDTNFILKNYPQTTEDAIKFENEVSDVQKCLAIHYDLMNEVSKSKTADEKRMIDNVVGYFETVGRVKQLVWKKDELDDKLKDFLLEDM